MEEISWLISIACTHIERKQNPKESDSTDNTFDSLFGESDAQDNPDRAALDNTFSEYCTIPERLKRLSRIAIICLAYFVREKMTGNSEIHGHEVVKLITIKENYIPFYLQGLDELEIEKWICFIPDEKASIPLRPYGWLQCRLEMGEQFAINNTCDSNIASSSYSSNAEYLDDIMKYLDQLAKKLKESKQSLCNEDIHCLPVWKSDSQYQEIEQKLLNTAISLPAASVKKHFNLTEWQFLFLIGIMGKAEQVIEYDFSDVNDVVMLFVTGYSARLLMRQHLAGIESPLVKNKLFESNNTEFFTSSKPSPKLMQLVCDKKPASTNIEDIKRFVNDTLFDLNVPKIKKNAVMLPNDTMDTINTIIHAEKPLGKKLRNELKKSLPAISGSPSGTTVLLFGNPGTGKTLTAHYIASELKLPILKVDCSKILSSLVSESEKNVRKLFEDYEMISKFLQKRPLLLLNEADQLLGRRIIPRSSADQSSNNVQNLFLEALESFEGILVATTNMKELLDSAYSWRFTYKLELKSPDAEIRKKIWEIHLPKKLKSESVNIDQLSKFTLSGGEIRLVLEQAVRSVAFHGQKKIEGHLLLELADKELIAAGKKHERTIGF